MVRGAVLENGGGRQAGGGCVVDCSGVQGKSTSSLGFLGFSGGVSVVIIGGEYFGEELMSIAPVIQRSA